MSRTAGTAQSQINQFSLSPQEFVKKTGLRLSFFMIIQMNLVFNQVPDQDPRSDLQRLRYRH